MSKNKTKIVDCMVIEAKRNKFLINDELRLKICASKKRPGTNNGGRKPGSKNRMTLNKLSNKVDDLANNLNKLASNLNKLSNNLNVVTNKLNKLTKVVTDGFANVNHRIDNLVKVNNLKE